MSLTSAYKRLHVSELLYLSSGLWRTSNYEIVKALFIVLAMLTVERWILLLDSRLLGEITAQLAIDNVSTQKITWNVCIWGALTGLSPTLSLYSQRARAKVRHWAEATIRQDFHDLIMNQSLDFHSSDRSTEFNHASSLCDTIPSVLEDIFFVCIPQLVDFVIVGRHILQELGLFTFAVFNSTCAVVIITSVLMSKRVIDRADRYYKAFWLVDPLETDQFSHAETVILHGLRVAESKLFASTLHTSIDLEDQYHSQFEISNYIRTVLFNTGVTISLYFCVLNNNVEIWVTTSFVLLKLRTKAIQLLDTCFSVSKRAAAFDQLSEILRSTTRSTKKPQLQMQKVKKPTRIEFKYVTWPKGSDRPVLKNLSFNLDTPQNMAIVGRSGAGKTTIFRILARLEDNWSGEVLIDNSDIRGIDADSLRSWFAFLPQPVLHLGSTIDKVLARICPEASQPQMIEACVRAALHESDNDVADLARAVKQLSGGQKQRLALAAVHLRLICRDVSIVALDEPTNGLDSETAMRVMNNLYAATSEITCFIITHNLREVKQVAPMAVLEVEQVAQMAVSEGGKVTETGYHEHLVASSVADAVE